MKTIKFEEILKDANVKLRTERNKIFEHSAESNGETILAYTQNEKVSIFLSALERQSGERFRIFKALRDKANKFDGQIKVLVDNRLFMVTITKIGEIVFG